MLIPADDVVALSTTDDAEQNLRRMEAHPHTRYPLVGEELTDFRGIVYSPVLNQYREELAVVIEDGEVVGMVTVTDLFEAVMGDIEDPIDK